MRPRLAKLHRPDMLASPSGSKKAGVWQPRLMVVNGDSNTFGSEMATPGRTAWPAVVAEHLDVALVNLAADGGSNRRVLRTTVELLPAICDRRGVLPHEVLFVAMWTFPNRREQWGAEPQPFVVEGEAPGKWRTIGPWHLPTGDPAALAWFRELDHADAAVHELLTMTVLLEHWLAAFGCLFGLTVAFDIVTDGHLTQHASLVAQMSDEHYVAGINGLVDAPFRCLVHHIGDLGPRGHALERSHRHYAEEHLLPWIRARAARA